MNVRSTTVLAVLRGGNGAIGSDGQVTLGNTAVKHGAVKVRKLFGGKVLVGFAGGAADAFTLFEKFEGHLEQYRGHLKRATVELAREWRSDRILRKLEAIQAAGAARALDDAEPPPEKKEPPAEETLSAAAEDSPAKPGAAPSPSS